MLDIRWVGELRYGQITLHVIGFIRKVADSFTSILLFCQSFSISRLIKGLVRISGKRSRHARVSNDLTLRLIRYPRTYTQRLNTTVVQGGGGRVDESSSLRFLTFRSNSKRFCLQWKAFHLLDKMRLLFHGWWRWSRPVTSPIWPPSWIYPELEIR